MIDEPTIPEHPPTMQPDLPRDEDAVHGENMVINMGPSHPSIGDFFTWLRLSGQRTGEQGES